MAFEPVDHKGTQGGAKELRIHNSDPQGYITAEACREWFQHHTTLTLFVDHDHSLLGIKRGPIDEGDTYTLSTRTNSDGGQLTLTTALQRLNITPTEINETWQFPLAYDPDESLIVADLKPLVETHTQAVHCEECGHRYATSQGLKTHYGNEHDDTNPRQLLEELDPDDIDIDIESTHTQHSEEGTT